MRLRSDLMHKYSSPTHGKDSAIKSRHPGTGLADLYNWICSQFAAEVDMHIWLVEGLDGNGIGVLPSHHLQHHLIPANMSQLLHSEYCLDAHLQQAVHLFA